MATEYDLMTLIGTGGKQPKAYVSDTLTTASAVSAADVNTDSVDTGFSTIVMLSVVPQAIDSSETVNWSATESSGTVTVSVTGNVTGYMTFKVYALGY